MAAQKTRMPLLFIAHGNPMNAIEDNEFTRALAGLAADLPKPEAVLVVSSHWQTHEPRVLASAAPATIHDFGGFPRELYEIEYPAAGAPDKAALVCELAPQVVADDSWGLDHASWAPLRHIWPDADVPVFELSVDMTASAQDHWRLAQQLSALRDHGVLVVGGGNIVHSFAGISWEPGAEPQPWAQEFDAWIADAIVRGDAEALIDYNRAGTMARLSVPTTDHYLPLLYPAAMADASDEVSFPYAGVEMGSMSMRCVRWG